MRQNSVNDINVMFFNGQNMRYVLKKKTKMIKIRKILGQIKPFRITESANDTNNSSRVTKHCIK